MSVRNVRVCIYPKDVQRITGKTYRQARLYLMKVKVSLDKEPHQLVSIDEFCEFSGLKKDEVISCIIGWLKCSIWGFKQVQRGQTSLKNGTIYNFYFFNNILNYYLYNIKRVQIDLNCKGYNSGYFECVNRWVVYLFGLI